jgi:Neuraminidase (sialidase)
VEPAAERPAMTRLGNTTALFYGKMVGAVREIFLKTSTDDGATWSAATQLTSGSPAHVFQMQALNLDGTIHLFWSRSDTSGQLQYITSGNLSSWSARLPSGSRWGRWRATPCPTSMSPCSLPGPGP